MFVFDVYDFNGLNNLLLFSDFAIPMQNRDSNELKSYCPESNIHVKIVVASPVGDNKKWDCN